jgi:hypothetical protein
VADASNFIVRESGKNPGSFYIDYSGSYKLNEIAGISGMKASDIKKIYLDNGAVFDKTSDVYYFKSREFAINAITSISLRIKKELRGKLIFLTMSEIEYIRKALINEGANTFHIKEKIKDAIFTKLNI